ncbi:MAG: symmetrical bis(5'-nucleosyl)-tetraphosphatase [Colwellia sp.]|nr:symmetrical bis(5'-nucleosyl)-tetraphosphatase [Colwellia sp.]
MALYIVGDLQGCLTELQGLLKQVDFIPTKDELWLVGDLVARGPRSLETLRFLKSLGDCVKPVLGNHDLHLLATYAGHKKVNPKDCLGDLLAAADVDELMDWLAQQPLIRQLPNEEAYMSHAGLSPQWTIEEALLQAHIAHKNIASKERSYWLKTMYGDQGNDWNKVSNAIERFRYTINALTRMRYCDESLTLEFQHKDPPNLAPKNLKPWFELVSLTKNQSWVFGHWAALMGVCATKNIYALDTGCVWRNHLTMIRWHDKQLFIENHRQVK